MTSVIDDVLSVSAALRSALPSALRADSAHHYSSGDERIPRMATPDMRDALPRLPDDALVGVDGTAHVVPRDNEPDLRFTGTLLASVAPEWTPERWKELRVYRTTGGRLVLSETGRSVIPGERDRFKALIWDPTNPQWIDANTLLPGEPTETGAIAYAFGFTPLAKQLHAKLGLDTMKKID
jgi:hypothetical protein